MRPIKRSKHTFGKKIKLYPEAMSPLPCVSYGGRWFLRKERRLVRNKETPNQALKRPATVSPCVSKDAFAGGLLRVFFPRTARWRRSLQLFQVRIIRESQNLVEIEASPERQKGPGGEGFLDRRKFEGPIPEMVEDAISHVHASIRKINVIEGLHRREIPEYTQEAADLLAVLPRR
jgi:hypothetical protein